MTRPSPNRREFLNTTAAGLAAAAMASAAEAQQVSGGPTPAGIRCGPLGKTGGERQPALPRWAFQHQSQETLRAESLRLIQRAVDEGITFMDNAWDYHDGGAEEWMGKALAEGRPTRQGLPDDQGLRQDRQGRTGQPRRQPAPAQDRSDRPLAVSRDRSTTTIRTGSSPQDGAIQTGLKALKEGQGPLPRIHRP